MSNQYVVTLLDSTGIQNYIFGSNRLRENIGASELVAQATSSFIEHALREALNEEHDVHDLSTEHPLEDNANQRAEIIFQGGGNVALLFRNIDDAKATVRALSRMLLERAPGLDVAAVHSDPFDWNTETLADTDNDEPGIMRCLAEKMAQYKQQRAKSTPLAGLGVTLACRATGLPATCIYTDPEGNSLPISADIAAKITRREEAKTRLRDTVFRDPTIQALLEAYTFPERFDDMGRSHGEVSYLAVVHADGNGMSKHFQDAGKGQTNRAYINKVRDLSSSINKAGINALCKTVAAMEAMLRHTPPQTKSQAHEDIQTYLEDIATFVADLPEDTKNRSQQTQQGECTHFLPFRPLVYGGDDITFVCDGRLGLALATRYIQEFEQETEHLLHKRVYASAGVAIVKTHHPFVRAYELAEHLCQNAKRFVRKRQSNGDGDASAIDWHVVASGRGGSIADIREREYTTNDEKSLNLRPLLVQAKSDNELRTWSVFEQAAWILKYGDDWRERRNKVMALRETLRQGKNDVQHFRTRYGIEKLPQLAPNQPSDSQESGFLQEHCLYFDAIEALDIFLPLEPVTMLDTPKEQPE